VPPCLALESSQVIVSGISPTNTSIFSSIPATPSVRLVAS
jgi:hypothetical protein